MPERLSEDQYFLKLTKSELWQRYCGFLDLSVSEFMDIQNEILMDEIDLVFPSILGNKILGNKKPQDVDEFRKNVPITTYRDYEPYFSKQDDKVLSFVPEFWNQSTGRSGYFKWFPQNREYFTKAVRAMIASFILASADKKGRVNIGPGCRFIDYSASKPFGSGYILEYFRKSMSVKVFPDPAEANHLPFEERFKMGFVQSLREGIDIVGAISNILVRMGEIVETGAYKHNIFDAPLDPRIYFRYFTALYKSHKEKRNILPRDLWSTKAIIAYGMDTEFNKEAIKKYWGIEPFVIYGCAEGIFMAMQSWSRQSMTFFSNLLFFEFIPYSNTGEPAHDDTNPYGTVLLNELEEGKLYEPVITQSCGMPLIRYRMYDLIKVVSLSDPVTGIKLPQIVFQRRIDEVIKITGFTQLDEKTIFKSLLSAGIDNDAWFAVSDSVGDKTFPHIYIEKENDMEQSVLEKHIGDQLLNNDISVQNIKPSVVQYPVKVTFLSKGTFSAFENKQIVENSDLAPLKPRRINPSSETLQNILEISAKLHKESNESSN